MDPQTIPQQNISGISGGGELSLYQFFIASPLFAEFTDFESPDRRIFLDQFGSLSLNLREFISSPDTATAMFSVGLSYDLEDHQISKIAGAVRELLLGKIFIKDFPITLSSKLGIDDIKEGEIANKIISKSFGPIIEDVKRIQRSKFPDKIMQMQKESRPEGLNQASAKPAPIKTEVEPPKPTEVQPQRPTLQPPTPQQMRPSTQVPPQPQKPQFKIPDLGQSFSSPPSKLDSVQPQGVNSGNGDKAQKSFEEELEKVAGVIDLRNKPKE